MIHCWKDLTSDVRELAFRAWSSGPDMQVLADLLIEKGWMADLISPEGHALPKLLGTGRPPETRDDGLYWLECAVRNWILRLYEKEQGEGADTLEVRVTGIWPDSFFTIVMKPISWDAEWSSKDVRLKIPQPRLLRDHVLVRERITLPLKVLRSENKGPRCSSMFYDRRSFYCARRKGHGGPHRAQFAQWREVPIPPEEREMR